MPIPKLRFKDKDGKDFPEWTSTQLKNVAQINPSSPPLPKEFIYVDLESVEKGQLIQENLIKLENAPSRAQRLLQKDDILFQMVRPYQQNNLFFDKKGLYVASTGYAQIRTLNNPKFLYHSLHTKGFVTEVLNKCTGTSYPAINSTDLANISINIPTDKLEQTKIADFLTILDTRINQQEKQCQLLEQYKKGIMQQIFSQQLRFKDDNGKEFPEWEIKHLHQIAERVARKNKENNQNILTISAQQGLVNQEQFFNKLVSAKDVRNYYLLYRDEFAYNKSYSKGYPMGAIKKLINYDKGVVSTLYICFKFTKGNTKFFEQYFESGRHNRELEKIAQEGARNHGLLNLGIDDFFSTELLIPRIEEQNKIANFLTAIDDKINLVKAQLEQLNTYKKGLLQQLFI